jgi:hypothetical protein
VSIRRRRFLGTLLENYGTGRRVNDRRIEDLTSFEELPAGYARIAEMHGVYWEVGAKARDWSYVPCGCLVGRPSGVRSS